jgi:hypothetical protein
VAAGVDEAEVERLAQVSRAAQQDHDTEAAEAAEKEER